MTWLGPWLGPVFGAIVGSAITAVTLGARPRPRRRHGRVGVCPPGCLIRTPHWHEKAGNP